MNVFTYGSLMYEEVFAKLVKTKYQCEPALLKGYARKQIKNKTYPGIIKVQEGSVEGIMYKQLKQQDLQILHHFESNDEYKQIMVAVRTQSGEDMEALAYLYTKQEQLEEYDWRQKDFQEKYKQSFAQSHLKTLQ